MKKDSNKNLNDPCQSNIAMNLYRLNRDNQELYMKQQWLIIYYAVLLYGGVYAIFDKAHKNEPIFFVVATLIFILSSAILCSLCSSLQATIKAEKKLRENDKNLAELHKIMFGIDPKSKSIMVSAFLFFSNTACYFFLLLLFSGFERWGNYWYILFSISILFLLLYHYFVCNELS